LNLLEASCSSVHSTCFMVQGGRGPASPLGNSGSFI
jgi:hypothetical protein